MSKILITGSSGRIGQALANLPERYDIIPYDLPEYDATNYNQLVLRLAGCSALIHLAFDLRRENSKTGREGNPANLLMGQVALAAVAEAGVQKCIMASSVNAVRAEGYNNESYRTTKLQLEAAADFQAQRYPDTAFTSIRFGRIEHPENPRPEVLQREGQSWISIGDACGLVGTILEADHQPDDGHRVVFGVSNRPASPFAPDEVFGWRPQDWFGIGSAQQ